MDDIKITRVMIEAGAAALRDASDFDDDELVTSIYRAMAAAAGLPSDENEGRPARER